MLFLINLYGHYVDVLFIFNFQNTYNFTGIHIENGLIPSFVPPGHLYLEVIYSIKINSTFLDYNKLKFFANVNAQ